MAKEFSDADQLWVRKNYPGLIFKEKNILVGRLFFQMVYDTRQGGYIINPTADEILGPGKIFHMDDYHLIIAWGKLSYPLVLESGKKIETVAKQRRIPLLDMHLFKNGVLCLAAPQQLEMAFQERFSLSDFIEGYVIPYLFQQTHFRKHNEWAWKPAAHGASGILEWYEKQSQPANKLIVDITVKHLIKSHRHLLFRPVKRHHACPCGSRNNFHNCCPTAFVGLAKLRKVLSRD